MAKGMQNMMKQAQKLQQQMVTMQEEMGKKIVEGSAGGGMVTAMVNGSQELVSISIDPEVVDPEDVELLEDLIVAAISNGREKAKDMMEEEMGRLIPGGLGSLGLPGLG
jgi:nucleoid-associated protein EbfC